ncbi:DUF3757 domain-containing protein [Pseudomonas sp. B22129]|uniref:DUF3757 domain-containing protein n=1 Tax=Pseudomonas sp. B22129 TaxID=3235111 RepID=UPI003783D769
MITKLMCLFILVAASFTQAKADESCPFPSAIHYVDGHYQATAGKTLWQSPKVESHDFADRFIGALFMPGKDKERKNGFLERCVYLLGSGQTVSLRYGAPEKVNAISLKDSLFWEPMIGPLGENVYICRDNLTINCPFTVEGKH